MEFTKSTLRQVMDWRAAVIAGLLAGALTMLFWMILWSVVTAGSIWTPFHQTAALLLGENVLTPSQTIDFQVVLAGTVTHLFLSVLYTIILAFIIHRWGLIVGIVGGALYGLSLYLINYLTFSAFFPWFYPLQSWMMVVGHVFFGALAGGLYEALERDVYVEVDTPAVEESSSA